MLIRCASDGPPRRLRMRKRSRNLQWQRLDRSSAILTDIHFGFLFRAPVLRGFSDILHARLTSFFAHGSEFGIGRKMRDRFWQILVERITAFLLNLAVLIAVSTV
jgi:hypothetical protein